MVCARYICTCNPHRTSPSNARRSPLVPVVPCRVSLRKSHPRLRGPVSPILTLATGLISIAGASVASWSGKETITTLSRPVRHPTLLPYFILSAAAKEARLLACFRILFQFFSAPVCPCFSLHSFCRRVPWFATTCTATDSTAVRHPACVIAAPHWPNTDHPTLQEY